MNIEVYNFLKASDLAEKGITVSDRDNPNFLQQLIFRIIHE